MKEIHPFMTLESLPETMSKQGVKQLMAYITTNVAGSTDFAELDELQRVAVIDFCMSIQEILLTAYDKP